MPGGVTGAAELAALSARLKEAGATGLRRELYKAISAAGEDLAREIASPENLKPHMPDRYAGVLSADLSVRVYKRGGPDAYVTIRAEGRTSKRKIVPLNDRGLLVHPVFGRGGGGAGNPLRRTWKWKDQFSHVRPGFFTDPAEAAAPAIRKKIESAMSETSRKITGG